LITKTDANNPTCQPANANESVHYHHCNDDDSCHGCIDQVTIDDSGLSVEWSLCPPSRVPSQGRCNDLIARTDANDPTWRPTNANKSVHYHHRNDDESCHGCIDPVTIGDSGDSVERSLRPPSWVHVFAKSTQPSSIRTQSVSIAYIEKLAHKKAIHR
jgi:hypothetical protein